MRCAAACLLLVGCATTIVPPAEVRDPVTVYLLDHGRHAGLLLPRAPDRLVEYAYGEWGWFAQNETGFLDALGALFWPTRGTLGRREPVKPEGVPIRVERERCARLLKELDAAFLAGSETRVFNPEYGMEFVPAPDDYHVFNNSNRATADWLEKLGCEVSGSRMVSDWEIRPAAPRAARTEPPRTGRAAERP